MPLTPGTPLNLRNIASCSRIEQLVGTRSAVRSSRDNRAVVRLFCDCRRLPIPWQQMGTLRYVPFVFSRLHDSIARSAVDSLEKASKVASAEVANWLFILSRTPFLR